jgi:phage gpG-like protein
MNFQQFTDKTLKDIEVKATELFDRNFEQGGFFGSKWKERKIADSGRGLLMGTGRLRKGIHTSKRSNNTITWQFDVPYAKIHNEGGTIKTTQNVRAFNRTVKGKVQKVRAFSRKVNISIPQRQFIGDHKQLRAAIVTIVDRNLKKLSDEIIKNRQK